jgi:hypothetical protein
MVRDNINTAITLLFFYFNPPILTYLWPFKNIGLVEEDSDDSDDSDDSSDNDMMVVDSVGKDLLGDSEGPAEPTSQKLRTGQPNRRKPKIEEVRR